MKRDTKQFNSRGVVLALGGGAALMLVAAQLVAKPNNPTAPVASAAARATTRPTTSASTTARVANSTLASSPLVGAPPVRELFRPLVAPPKAGTKMPGLPNAPKLPAAAPAKPVASTPTPTTATPTPAAPAAPTGPNVGEIQMLGVVEFSDGVKALLKKTSSGESRYFAKGEDAFGFTVGEISATDVSLTHDGKTDKIAMSTAIPVEGSNGTSVASTSGFSGGSFGGGSFRERGDRGSRGDRGNRGGGDGNGRSDSGFSTSQIMSLPTWTERLKKLEEIKAQIEPEKYDRLKKFMESRVAAEKGK